MATPDSYTKLLVHSNTTNGSTTFTDSSPSGHTVNRTGVIHSTTKAKFDNSSFKFDNASNQYLTIPASADFNFSSSDCTIEMWINSASVGSDQELYYQATGGNGIQLSLRSGRGVEIIADSTQFWTGTGYMENDTWHHIALVKYSSSIYLYIDGVRRAAQAGSFPNGSSAALQIGNRTSDFRFNGYMDEYRVSNTARWTSSTFTLPRGPYAVTGTAGISGNIDGTGATVKIYLIDETTDEIESIEESSVSYALPCSTGYKTLIARDPNGRSSSFGGISSVADSVETDNDGNGVV